MQSALIFVGTRFGDLFSSFLNFSYRACALKWHPDRHQGSFKVYFDN